MIIGVHSDRKSETMSAYVKEQKIPYPVAADTEGKTQAAFHADSFPDYYLIDRAGKVRFADLANKDLDRAIALLLKEKAPSKGAKPAPKKASGETSP